MNNYSIKAKFSEFPLSESARGKDTAVVPTVKGSIFLKYGKHAYYFYNFKKRKCILVEIAHKEIISPGLGKFLESLNKRDSFLSKVKLFFEKFHYGFSFPEQIMLMTVPHTATSLGDGKFLINLWSYVGYLEIDCKSKTVSYRRREVQDEDHVLGSQQWHRHGTGETYYTTYSLPESMKKISNPLHPVPCKVYKYKSESGKTEEVWNGFFSDYAHAVLINKTARYCVVCELGMFQDRKNETIPSKVLILDMKRNRHWVTSKFIVAAHAQFDPEEHDVIYFSQHNFKFLKSSIFKLLRKATYSLKFIGPAAVYKYKLTEHGPEEIGVFTEPDMFRLTNFHIFEHRGQKLLAAMGFPNFIYLADARTMKFIRKITVKDPQSQKYFSKKTRCVIGTFSPSSDGELLYVQTTRSFQTIEIERGTQVENTPFFFNHTAANHMLTSNDSSW